MSWVGACAVTDFEPGEERVVKVDPPVAVLNVEGTSWIQQRY
jgi:nitrite reductase/ring-hydroxylating ferredoxin subunit